DRLIKDLRLEGICGMDDGNAFLPRFMEGYNRQFVALHLHRDRALQYVDEGMGVVPVDGR
ncbi:hypothetical protein CN214_15715, partial [Sinorhizobium meliloti]